MTMSRAPLIPCRHCAGSGKVDLPAHLEVVRQLLIEQGGRTAEDIAAILLIEHSAACNRLAALRGLGFAECHKNGKTLYWWPRAAGGREA